MMTTSTLCLLKSTTVSLFRVRRSGDLDWSFFVKPVHRSCFLVQSQMFLNRSLTCGWSLIARPWSVLTQVCSDCISTRISAERLVAECPICMMNLAGPKARVLLSCSHVFHDACLTSFERYSVRLVHPISAKYVLTQICSNLIPKLCLSDVSRARL